MNDALPAEARKIRLSGRARGDHDNRCSTASTARTWRRCEQMFESTGVPARDRHLVQPVTTGALEPETLLTRLTQIFWGSPDGHRARS